MNLPTYPFQTDRGSSYLNPPVVEALCEVYFTSTDWDDSIPDLFYEEIKERFPNQEEQLFHRVDFTVDVPNETISSDMQSGPSRKLFSTEERDQIVQITENLFVFNQLTPYLSFHSWESIFYDVFNIFVELVSPQAVDLIGVRYLNQISIPKRRFQMSDYFTIYPLIPLESGNVHGDFLINCTIPQSEDGHILTYSFSKFVPEQPNPVPEPPGLDHQVFLLDLYDQASFGRTLFESEFKNHVRVAHKNVVQAFEGSITDRLRNLFNKE